MKKLLIFFSAGLFVSGLALYMYNTASAALTEGGDASDEEDLDKNESKQIAQPKSTKSSNKKSGQLQQAAINRNQDPDMHSAANSKTKSSTNEASTGNVD